MERGRSRLKRGLKKCVAVLLLLIMVLQGVYLAGSAASDVVIMLDPGHGGVDSGAYNSKRGLFERDLVLIISQYCKQELERYAGVQVYLARTSNGENPNIVDRVKAAKQKGADAYISIHINDANTASANGVECYVSYYDKYSLKDLGTLMLNQLTGVGFYNRGVKTSRSQNGTLYADGTLADFYSVVREPARLGMKGMLLEHGFINNDKDANLLTGDAQLKKIGVAHATALAQYYGLKLKGSSSGGSGGGGVVATTPILGEATASQDQCLTWARGKKATSTFLDNIPLYYEVAKNTGVNPVMAIAQYAHETGYGKYGGAVTEGHKNPCGLKKTSATGDTTNDFHTFSTWSEGIQAQQDHLALYAGQSGYPRANSPDPRHFAYLLGKAKTVEGLTGTWATDSAYANRILALMTEIQNTIAVVPTLTLSTGSMSINQGASATLSAYASPEGSVSWSSGNSSIATVEGGRVTGRSGGTVTITASCSNGATASCKVTVLPVASAVTFDPAEVTVAIGEQLTLKPSISPSNTFEDKLVWSSGDSSIAAVTAEGVVTGIKNGSAVITARVNDSVYGTCTVQVISKVTGVTLDVTEKSLYTGMSFTLTPEVVPASATNRTVTWNSSDPAVAAVDGSGKVTAGNSGNAVITATTHNGLTASCTVTVLAGAQSVALSPPSSEMKAGQTLQINATVLPENTFDRSITWVSSDVTVAGVSLSGLVTAKQAGTAVITAKAHNGVSSSCTVTVTKEGEAPVITNPKTQAYTGESFQLSLQGSPYGLTWHSSDSSVASVSGEGKVTCLTAGRTTISVRNSDGKESSFQLEVLRSVEKIILTALGTLQMGESGTVSVTISPADAHNRTLTWSSSAPDIASVEGGTVTAKGEGTVVIRATAHNGVAAECTIQILSDHPTAGQVNILDKPSAAYTGDIFTLSAQVTGLTNVPTVSWYSSDPTVAKIDSNGQVTCLRAGITRMEAAAAGAHSDAFLLRVEQGVERVQFDQSAHTLYVGSSLSLKAGVFPSDAANQTLTWSSSDPEIASVDQNGLVTAKAAGSATITATAHNGKQAFCLISVDTPADPERVVIQEKQRTATAGESFTLTATVYPEGSGATLRWSSSNPLVASIDETGRVTCLTGGTTELAASTDSGASASYLLTVVQPVTEIRLSATEATLQTGSRLQLTAEVLPENATEKGIVWSSSRPGVASVSAAGLVTALSAGETVVTAETSNGIAARCVFTVTQAPKPPEVPPTDLMVVNTITSAFDGDSFVLGAVVLPINATSKTVRWTSQNPDIADVSAAGRVKCLKAGSTQITGSTSNGITKSFVLTVKQRVTQISLEENALTLTVGSSTSLTARIHPENAANTKTVWRVDNPGVVQVDGDGVVTALGMGSAVVTVTSHNGLKAFCRILVLAADSQTPLPPQMETPPAEPSIPAPPVGKQPSRPVVSRFQSYVLTADLTADNEPVDDADETLSGVMPLEGLTLTQVKPTGIELFRRPGIGTPYYRAVQVLKRLVGLHLF